MLEDEVDFAVQPVNAVEMDDPARWRRDAPIQGVHAAYAGLDHPCGREWTEGFLAS